MATLVSRMVFHLLLPVLGFLLIGVPLETYVRGLSGFFSNSSDMAAMVQEHLFLEAAACFYCITILLEILVIVYRPHLRTREGVPVKAITVSAVVMAIILTASYIWIRVSAGQHDLDVGPTRLFLLVMMIATALMALAVHAVDFFSSSEVAPCPKPKRRSRARTSP